MNALRHLLTAVQWGFLGYFILLNALYLAFAFLAVWRLRGYMGGRSAAERVYSHLQMPISLVVPAYNEAATITTSCKTLLQLRWVSVWTCLPSASRKSRGALPMKKLPSSASNW